MCGFAGFIGINGINTDSLLEKMGDIISHRGPDSGGYWHSPNYDIGFVHRRLSIVDLSKQANQPMRFDPSYILVFNGEIYNHQNLRYSLEANGVKFKTDHSDTETLYWSLIHLGLNQTLEMLEGMYSFVFCDLNKKRVYMARDRFGEKPLYYFKNEGALYFASEVKSLINSGVYTPSLDETAFVDYLSFRTAPTENSFYKGIKKLPAASAIEIDLTTCESTQYKYWSLLTAPKTNFSYEQLTAKVDSVLSEKINDMTQMDVPFGLYLSGGIDSTLLLHYLTKASGSINCFNISYEGDESSDESQRAKLACEKYNGIFHGITINSDDYLKAFENVVYHLDEPSAAPITVSQYFLSKLAREKGVPVVFSGEGGDEAFLGYPLWAKVEKLEQTFSTCPLFLKNAAFRFIHKLQPSKNRRIEYFKRLKSHQPIFWGGVEDFMGEQKNELLDKRYEDLIHDTYKRVIKPHRELFEDSIYKDDEYKWMSYLDSQIRLPELMLQRADRMTMANSVEGRAPLLNHKLFESAFGTSSDVLRHGKENKAVLKSIAADLYGQNFVYKPKQGFTAPMSKWHDEKLGKSFKERLMDLNLTHNFFNEKALKKLLVNDGRNNTLYFSLANFAYWHQRVIG